MDRDNFSTLNVQRCFVVFTYREFSVKKKQNKTKQYYNFALFLKKIERNYC